MGLPIRPIAALAIVWLLAPATGRAQESQLTEYGLKAAFLYNFAKFVKWPATALAQPTSPIVIGILGQNPFREELVQTIRGKTIDDHPLNFRECRTATEGTNCHILFISTSEKKRLPEIFAALNGSSVLTVGETDQFTETGGIINFFLQGTKIRFQINIEAANHAGLKISSKLLSLSSRPGG